MTYLFSHFAWSPLGQMQCQFYFFNLQHLKQCLGCTEKRKETGNCLYSKWCGVILIIKHLLCAKHCSKYFITVISFNLHHNPKRDLLLSFQFCWWRNWSLKRWLTCSRLYYSRQWNQGLSPGIRNAKYKGIILPSGEWHFELCQDNR